MSRYVATIADADILIHLVKNGYLNIVEMLFQKVIIPHYVLENEVRKKDYQSHEKLKAVLNLPNSTFELVNREDDFAINRIAKSEIADKKKCIYWFHIFI